MRRPRTRNMKVCLILCGVVSSVTMYVVTSQVHKSSESRTSKERMKIRDQLWLEMEKYNKDHKANESHRLPKVIGIGIKKCGTEGIINFLNHHPLVRIPAEIEMFFFDSGNTDYNSYKDRMPPTNDRQIAMEKTPIYFSEGSDDVPEKISTAIPNVKLILVVCDPTQRALSDYVQERIRYAYYGDQMIAQYESFDEYVGDYLPKVQRELVEWMEQKKLGELRKQLIKLTQTDYATTILSNGLYTAHIQKWLSVFNSSNLKIIDGERFIEDTGGVMEELQDFIGIPRILLREDFVKSPDHGFYCYRRFTEQNGLDQNVSRELKCLIPGKGRTRNGRKRISPAVEEKLRDFYHPFNEQFFKDVGMAFQWL